MAGAKREVEIKFAIADPAGIERSLGEEGGTYEGRIHEENSFYDDDVRALETGGRVLRLRLATGTTGSGEPLSECRLTFKEPVARGRGALEQGDPRFKVRTEVEVLLDDGGAMALILERLGLRCRLRYEKDRALWRLGEVLVTVDTLPFGHFVELEGAPEDIALVASRLGFDLAEGITKSYLDLLAEHP